MIKIGVVMSPKPDSLWTLMGQCGVEHAVAGIGLHPIPNAEKEDQPKRNDCLRSAKARTGRQQATDVTTPQ